MNSMVMMGAAACAAKCCPPHAIAAVAGAFAIGLVAGIVIGRCGKKKTCTCKKGAQGARPAGANRPAVPVKIEPRKPVPAGAVEIYVGNLSYDMTDEILKKEFGAFGAVDSARIVLNRYTGRSKGFGFVVMTNRAEAEKAIAALNDKELLGRKLRANEAQNTVKEG